MAQDELIKISFTGELGKLAAPNFAEALDELVWGSRNRIAVDLSETTNIGSEGLRAIFHAFITCQSQNHRPFTIVVPSGNQPILDKLTEVGFQTLIPRVESIEDIGK